MPARSVDSRLLPFSDRLGREPDHIIAKEAGVSRSVVVSYRKKLGIEAYQGYKFGIRPGTPGSDKPRDPGAKPKAKAKGTKKRKGGRRAAPTAKAAAPVAAAARSAAGTTRPRRARAFRGRRSKLDPFMDLIGTVADSEIAALAGVTPENVRAFRNRRGIAPHRAAGGAPKAPEKAPVSPRAAAKPGRPARRKRVAQAASTAKPPAAAPVASVPAAAFSVQIDFAGGSRSYAVVAADIAEAAQTAVARAGRRHKDGQVKAVQKIADLL